ncbi:Clp protease N-terminal domain-containing protein [Streptomyces roseicoloratus]
MSTSPVPLTGSSGRAPAPRVASGRLPSAAERRAECADFEDRLTAELMTAVGGARRRALRDGDRQIDTAHLLHSLVEADPETAAVLDEGDRLARVLGYLVQRSIGYGLRWQRAAEETGSGLPVVRGGGNGAAGWSPAAATALAGAFERAVRRGDRRVRGLDLLAALAADPGNRAAEVLRRAGVDALALTARIEEPSQQV